MFVDDKKLQVETFIYFVKVDYLHAFLLTYLGIYGHVSSNVLCQNWNIKSNFNVVEIHCSNFAEASEAMILKEIQNLISSNPTFLFYSEVTFCILSKTVSNCTALSKERQMVAVYKRTEILRTLGARASPRTVEALMSIKRWTIQSISVAFVALMKRYSPSSMIDSRSHAYKTDVSRTIIKIEKARYLL